MKEREINRDEAIQIIQLWQEERQSVEVVLRFSQGLTQTHPGRVTFEPDGRVVVAHVVNKDHYLTTLLDLSHFEIIRLTENENAITFSEPGGSATAFRSVTVARRKQ